MLESITTYKLGKKDYQARMMKGERPTLEALDDILPARGILFQKFRWGWSRFLWSRSWEQKQNPEVMRLQGILCRFCAKIRNLPISGQSLGRAM